MPIPRFRFTIRRMMVAVAVVAVAFVVWSWMSRGECLFATIVNQSGETMADVSVTDKGRTHRLGDLIDSERKVFGRYARGSTPVTLSYTDAMGRRVSAAVNLAVDLGHPVESDSWGGWAVITVDSKGITSWVRRPFL
jgi:hypothetical protein